MTRILFLASEEMIFLLESPNPAREIAAAVERGDWYPPAPMLCLIQGSEDGRPPRLRALRQGRLVVVTPAHASQSVRLPLISPRRRSVLRLLARGMDTKRIAAEVGIKQRTARWHIQELKRYLHASTLGELVSRASDLGLTE